MSQIPAEPSTNSKPAAQRGVGRLNLALDLLIDYLLEDAPNPKPPV